MSADISSEMTPEIPSEWLEQLASVVSTETSHGTRTLIEHLSGTCRLLLAWQSSREAALAGLFHSVWGTPDYNAKVTISHSTAVFLDPKARVLVAEFHRLGHYGIIRADCLDSNQSRDLLDIWLANFLEQLWDLEPELRQAIVKRDTSCVAERIKMFSPLAATAAVAVFRDTMVPR
jgi:hypothetical protein